MLGTFQLGRPLWLAVAAVLLVLACAWLRQRRSAAPRRARRLLRVRVLPVAAAGLVAAAALPLALVAGPATHALLAALAVAASLALTAETYRRAGPEVSRARALLAGALRTIAWLALLTLVARPVWQWTIIERHRPLLAVLLDNSRSMLLGEAGVSRATRANRQLARSRDWLARLSELYQVRRYRLGRSVAPAEQWQVEPDAPATALAAALRTAARLRDARNQPPAAVLLISDGAENLAPPAAVRQAALELAEQETALLAAGVGPTTTQPATVELDPLAVPARVGLRDRLRVPLRARTPGLTGYLLGAELLWDDQPVARRALRAAGVPPRVRTDFDTLPPGPGLHRLTVRLRLPAALGGWSYRRTAIVDVRQDAVRVLLLAGRPRSEWAFAVRALHGDRRIEVEQLLLPAGDGPGAGSGAQTLAWAGYDVILFGDLPRARLGRGALRRLAEAVGRRGAGLLLAGGRSMFNQPGYAGTALEQLSPVFFDSALPPEHYRPRLRPTRAGLRHAVLRAVTSGPADRAAEHVRQIWADLPPLDAAARLGPAKALATVLATDRAGRPLAVAHEVGRGRCLALACQNTWLWALASDAGFELHRRFWRQLVLWLANRRPSAWVLTDRPDYAAAAMRGGQQTVRVTAGVSGFWQRDEPASGATLAAELTLRPLETPNASQPRAAASRPGERRGWKVPLIRRGRRWVAELTADRGPTGWPSPGRYELTFTVRPARPAAGAPPAALAQPLTARSGFAVVQQDLERQPPTANLALLRQAAEATALRGGAYCPIEALPDLLRRLATTDRRRRLERHARYQPVAESPWLLLGLLAAALGLEWALRKRSGLS